MIAFLDTAEDNSEQANAVRDAVRSCGITLDVDIDVYRDEPQCLNRWGISRVPCLAFIHDTYGVAVDQIADEWLVGKSASTIKGRFTNAVKAYEAARAASA